MTYRDGSPRRKRSERAQRNAQLAARLTAGVDVQLRQLALLPPVHIADLPHQAPGPPLPGAAGLAAVLAAWRGPGGTAAAMTADLPATPRHPPARRAHPATAELPAAATDDTRRGQLAPRDRAAAWLRNAMLALAVLAAAAAVVSWDAQYVLVRAVKHTRVIAALEAGIPDVGALIFAALGIALALHGRRAIRARTLNVACAGISLAMNALASAPGWQDLAIWVMPSAVYALASDTLIGVVRAWATARARHTGQVLAGDEATPMAIAGGLLAWLLRLALAPPSTIAGFRRWALEECPVAPGRKATHTHDRAPGRLPPATRHPPTRRPAGPGKQARMLTLASQRHDLATVPLSQVSAIASQISGEVGLSPGTARRVLLAHVRGLQNGHPQEETP